MGDLDEVEEEKGGWFWRCFWRSGGCWRKGDGVRRTGLN